MKFSLLPFVFFLLCISVINAQKISYSEPLGNFDDAQFNVIGSVKNHIIIWEYFNNDYSTSRILVYDNDLKLLKKVKIGSLEGPLATLDFINEKDSFDVIYQYFSNHEFFCKRLGFDENGNNTHIETLNSYRFPNNVMEAGPGMYRVIQSPDKKNFILIRTEMNENLDKHRLSYILFANNKTRFDHSTELPYHIDSLTSHIYSLDNANHFIVVVSEGMENNKLMLYEINPGTGDVAGIQGAIREGVLNMESLNISHVNNRIFITAYWKNEDDGIFVWQPDLYNFSAGKDTIYSVETDTAFTSLKRAFLKTDVYPYHNTCNFFITAHQGGRHYTASDHDSSFSSGYYPESPAPGNFSGSFYAGRPTSVPLNNSNTINGVSTLNAYKDRDVNPALNNAWPSQNNSPGFAIDAFISYNKLLIYNIDKNQGVHWYTYLDDTIENELTSYINPCNNLNTNQLYLFYDKIDRNDKKMMGLLTIDNKGGHFVKPVIIMKTSYKYFFEGGKKITENAVLFPCRVKNRLAFIKVEVR